MKCLIIQENGRHEKNRNFRECYSVQRSLIKYGHQCDIWGKGHSNFSNFVPSNFNAYDIIIDLENYDDQWIPNLSNIKSYKIMWSIDSHCHGIEYYINRFKKNRYNLLLQATKKFLTTEIPNIWFPNCYDHTLIMPKIVNKRADVGFCGNICNRLEYLNFLKKNFNFISDIFVIGDDMVNAINSYKIHFNKNIADDINYRNFETIGCQIPLITNYNSQYNELGFSDGNNCMIYNNIGDLYQKITLLLSNDILRNSIAKNGYDLSKLHTYDKRIGFLLDYLKDKI